MSEPDDDRPLRLAQAAEICFRPGDMTVSGLRRERDCGNLIVFKIAGKEFTTRAEIAKMIERCTMPAQERRSSIAAEPVRSGEIAQAALRLKLSAFKKSLKDKKASKN